MFSQVNTSSYERASSFLAILGPQPVNVSWENNPPLIIFLAALWWVEKKKEVYKV